jgi:hypothetical protein
MSKQCTVALAFLAVCGVAVQGASPLEPQADETTTVEVYFASEHVPVGLKAGCRVDLMRVDGKSITPSGKVSYSTSGLAQNIEVVSVTTLEKPKGREQAVKVELRVTKAQAAMIERAKARLVTVTETTSDGQTKTERRRVPLRLELAKPKQK